MAIAGGDIVSQYFKKGAKIEISSNEDGFRGSWYSGTVTQPPKGRSNKVLVEYATLKDDEAGTRPLTEVLELVQLRPPPPRENRLTFKFSDEVDAYYHDGWWEGVITDVVGKDKYLVFFRGTREQIEFKASQLRLHREWVYGKWVPPLQEPQYIMPTNEKIPFSVDVEAVKEVIEHNFSSGDEVEASTDDEGFEGAWFAATVLKKINKGKYLIEYQNLRNDDGVNFLKEEVDVLNMRPRPPEIGLVDRFNHREEVDAWYNDGWWVGVVIKVLKKERYTVYFRYTDEELKFEHSDLRVHQEWRDGKWHIASQVLKL